MNSIIQKSPPFAREVIFPHNKRGNQTKQAKIRGHYFLPKSAGISPQAAVFHLSIREKSTL